MKQGRFWVALTAVTGVTLSLAACSGDDGGADGSVDIEWWIGDWDEDEANDIVEQFEADHPDVSVDLVVMTWDSMANQIKVALDSGDTPDVITELISRVALYADAGQLRDVSDWYGDDLPLDDFAPASIEAVTVEDTTYAVPYRWDAGAMVYNQDLFDQAGISEPPATWAELEEAAQQIYDSTGVYAYGWPLGNDNNAEVRWLNAYYSLGGTIEQGGSLDADASEQALEMIASGFEEGYVTPSSLESDNTALQNLLINEQIAFYYEGAYAIQPIQEAGINVGTAMWPGPDGPAQVSADGFSFMVPEAAIEAPELQEFVTFISSAENQAVMTDTFPARISAAENERFSDPLLQPFLEQQTEHAFPSPAFPGYEDMLPTIYAAVQSVALGDRTAAEANEDIISHAEQALS